MTSASASGKAAKKAAQKDRKSPERTHPGGSVACKCSAPAQGSSAGPRAKNAPANLLDVIDRARAHGVSDWAALWRTVVLALVVGFLVLATVVLFVGVLVALFMIIEEALRLSGHAAGVHAPRRSWTIGGAVACAGGAVLACAVKAATKWVRAVAK